MWKWMKFGKLFYSFFWHGSRIKFPHLLFVLISNGCVFTHLFHWCIPELYRATLHRCNKVVSRPCLWTRNRLDIGKQRRDIDCEAKQGSCVCGKFVYTMCNDPSSSPERFKRRIIRSHRKGRNSLDACYIWWVRSLSVVCVDTCVQASYVYVKKRTSRTSVDERV